MEKVKVFAFGRLDELRVEKFEDYDYSVSETIPSLTEKNIVVLIGPSMEGKKAVIEINKVKEIYDFINTGGKVIFIIPPNEEDFTSFKKSNLFELFSIEPLLISKKALLHKTEHIINIDDFYNQRIKKPVNNYI